MNIGIFYNPKQVPFEIAENLAKQVNLCGGHAKIFSDPEAIAEVERLVVLGGDGTVLHAARRVAELDVPLFGINYGHLGFLTEFEREDEAEAISLALDPSCQILQRSMIELDFNGEKKLLLNEVCLQRRISRDCVNRTVKISVTIDGRAAGIFDADGLIVSTPTGSTAYSLSAGGNIMMPECGTFQLTPVCAFSLRSRPIAYPDRYELSFELSETDTVILSGDGIVLGEVDHNDKIKIRKADRTVKFLTRDKHACFRRLTEKIN